MYILIDLFCIKINIKIIKDPEFPDNPKQAIINGFASVDNDLLDKAQELIS